MQISEEKIVQILGRWQMAFDSETGENAVRHSSNLIAAIQCNKSFRIFLGGALVVSEVVHF